MRGRGRKGFTLVELALVMVIGAIMILAAGIVLWSGQILWNKAWSKVNLQRDASYALNRMSRSIRGGSSAELESTGKGIKIYREADWIRFFLDESTNDIKCQVEGREPETVINGNIESLGFSIEGNKIGIDLKLKKDNLQDYVVSTVMMRNYGG